MYGVYKHLLIKIAIVDRPIPTNRHSIGTHDCADSLGVEILRQKTSLCIDNRHNLCALQYNETITCTSSSMYGCSSPRRYKKSAKRLIGILANANR